MAGFAKVMKSAAKTMAERKNPKGKFTKNPRPMLSIPQQNAQAGGVGGGAGGF